MNGQLNKLVLNFCIPVIIRKLRSIINLYLTAPMNCIICNSNTEYFFSKTYKEEPFASMMKGIGQIDYFRCSHCGFTFSKTHFEMENNVWEKLNSDFHHYIENHKVGINQPPYLEQASMLKVLSENGIIDVHNILDYAGGYGTLGKILQKYFSVGPLPVYEPFVHNPASDIYVNKKDLKTYKTVFNSAVFEHLRDRQQFEEINNLVTDDGCLILHTVICETIPPDPDWFYLAPPVHCSFHTNKSMEILMRQWSYRSSLYVPGAKSWILFKKEPADLPSKVAQINGEFQTEYMIYKQGFVDYWKGFA